MAEQVRQRSDLHPGIADGNELYNGVGESHNNKSGVSGPDTIPLVMVATKGPAMFAFGVVFEDATLYSNQQR